MKKEFIVFTLLVLTLVASPAMAGTTGKITGMVKDAQSNEALPGSNVTIVGTTLGAASDINGHYFILNVPPGRYTVRASQDR